MQQSLLPSCISLFTVTISTTRVALYFRKMFAFLLNPRSVLKMNQSITHMDGASKSWHQRAVDSGWRRHGRGTDTGPSCSWHGRSCSGRAGAHRCSCCPRRLLGGCPAAAAQPPSGTGAVSIISPPTPQPPMQPAKPPSLAPAPAPLTSHSTRFGSSLQLNNPLCYTCEFASSPAFSSRLV